MSTCAPCDPCSNPVSKGDLDRWTSSLKHVLANQTAMNMFEEYLQEHKLDSADMLEVWKMCDALLRHVNHHSIKNETSRIRDDYEAIVERATQAEGLTGLQLQKLEEAKLDGPKKIVSRVEKLRQTAYELMKHDYKLFRKKLLKDAQSSCCSADKTRSGAMPKNDFRPN